MSVAELKEELIRQFAEKLSATTDEKVLRSIIVFLKSIDGPANEPLNLSAHYDEIKATYGSVLKQLAE